MVLLLPIKSTAMDWIFIPAYFHDRFLDLLAPVPDVKGIIQWRQGFIASPPGNQTRAAKTELCAGAILNDWQATLKFDACYDNCTATYCPQPAQDYMTDKKAQECAGDSYSAIAACRDGQQGASLLKASLAEAAQLHIIDAPTTYINGPSRFCRGLFSIERTAFHSHGLDSHSRVLLCDSMTQACSPDTTPMPRCSPRSVRLTRARRRRKDALEKRPGKEGRGRDDEHADKVFSPLRVL